MSHFAVPFFLRLSPALLALACAPSQHRPLAQRPVFSNCVLHAGEAKQHSGRERSADGVVTQLPITGSCAFNAECGEEQGRTAPGDGLVDLDCEGTDCRCELVPTGSRQTPVTFGFTLATPCTTTEHAERLLIERCMVGMTLAQ